MLAYSPPPPWSFAPFALLLLAIAVFPLVHRLEHFWEKNRNKLFVALALAAATLGYYGFIHGGVPAHGHEGDLLTGWPAVRAVLEHAVVEDYIPFIVLLFSLYTISGGILLTGDLRATPVVNCAFLGAGALLASFIGTTGASMLLIRPLLRTNSERKHTVHTVVFFIFLVSNIGGSLTPLGDPPLFLGYLRGVPFWWTLHMLWPMLFLTAALLTVYFVWDRIAYRKEEVRDLIRDATQIQPLKLAGGINFLWLFAVVACVATVDSSRPIPGTGYTPPPHAREVLLLLLAGVSWLTTPRNRELRHANGFTFGAILEVACLFIGIFICMQTPVEYLRAEGPRLGLQSAPGFFWAAGSLSSFLDNAPTYVVFFETGKALTESLLHPAAGDTVAVAAGQISGRILLALSMGAVFMGANTYIGNGPNFMVKAIAEKSGVRMPSFFGYMAYSACILIPAFLAVMVIFLL